MSTTGNDLPLPGSEELNELVRDREARVIYKFLYERRTNPPTMLEIRYHVAAIIGEAHAQTDRRVRDLRRHFDVPCVRVDGRQRYQLRGWSSRPKSAGPTINSRVRAAVLQPGRCYMCGRTPKEHGVVLVVDHKIPQAWGGSDNEDNLQPLCEECNAGKKDLFGTYDSYTDAIRAAITFDEPHRRIGELLKALANEWVPGDLVGLVASAGQYQEDWQKRTRELRTIGWTIETRRGRRGPRVRTEYRATVVPPWPTGSVAAEIRRRERAK